MDRQSALHELMNSYSTQPYTTAFSNGAVPTFSAVGRDAVRFLDQLEKIEPEIVKLSKRYSPKHTFAEAVVVGRPLFDPTLFFVGVYAWPAHRRYLTQDLILGSTRDGGVVYHSGPWPGMPSSTAYRHILELGKDAAATGDFGARPVGGNTYLADHRNESPSSSQFDPRVWDELDAAMRRPRP